MQFDDGKKEGSIEFVRIRNKGSGSTPVFQLTLSKPVQGSEFFDIHDIREMNGITGIRCIKGGEIAKKLNPKGDVLLSMPSEIIESVRKTNDEELDKLKKEAKKNPETWKMWHGCDTGRMYISPNTELGWEFRPDLEKVKDILEKEFYTNPAEFNTGVKDDRDNTIVPHSVVIEVYNKIIEKREVKKAAKQTEMDAIFQKAKETGDKQILERYPVECSDPNESCDLDIVTVYAMPDGTTQRTQNHTW